MIIERDLQPTMTLEQFADAHGFVMRVSERAMNSWQRERKLKRFVASFKGVEMARGSLLVSSYGEGDTEAEAIADYGRQISGERVRCNLAEAVQVPRIQESR